METSTFHHALKIQSDVCIGCAHCMRVCPTEALRVRGGKALLQSNRCIDCGECYRVCPTGAIIVEQDDFNSIFNYKYRVALVPSVLLAQYPEDVSVDMAIHALLRIGFTKVVIVEDSVDYLITRINAYIINNPSRKPIISSFCPAIVRLVQVRFPWLVGNIMLVKPPIDLTSSFIRRKFTGEGIPEQEVGIFYITPCAAKIAAVKSPEGEDVSEINGVINMDLIYNRTLRDIRSGGTKRTVEDGAVNISPKSITWALTGGEALSIEAKGLAIDGISNVIEFLEKMETSEVHGVDFLELRACDESCAGGILTVGNSFLSAERLRKQARYIPESKIGFHTQIKISEYSSVLNGKVGLNRLEPRSIVKLDDSMVKAMNKMERVNRYLCYLPGIDCGVCGTPSCQALAEDIVQGEGSLSQCVFLQKIMEQNKLDPKHSFRIMKKIWGENRFIKDCDKPKHKK